MTAENLASVAGALADPTRARMLIALMDARVSMTARELAQAAGVAPSTATEHLNRLVTLGLLAERRRGRYRDLQLAGPAVAEALEALAALGTQPAPPVRGMRDASVKAALARARTCYDHLAGALGIAVTDALVGNGVLVSETLSLTRAGERWLNEALEAPFRPGRRALSRPCLDLTERRPHVAGAVGAHVATVFSDRGWVRPTHSSRAVVVTPAGEAALDRLLGAHLPAERAWTVQP